MQPNELELVRNQLKHQLKAFLANRGIQVDSRGFFKCIAHQETDASAHFIPGTDDTKWFCMGCGSAGDVFDAAHHLDGLPLTGAAWYTETLVKLASEFGVILPSDDRPLSAAEQRELDIYRAYDRASRLVVESKRSALVETKIGEYGWSPRTLRVFGIGSVSSTDSFLRAMVKAGFSKDFLKEIGLLDERIFRPECLIFTIKDAGGRPVGFSARYLEFEEKDRKLDVLKEALGSDSEEYQSARKKLQGKYVNTDSKKNPVYRKKATLLGLHAAKGTSGTLYVFEGNADVVTAFDRGLVNSTAVCGSSFSEEHLEQAIGLGFRHFVFVMDGDQGGQGATRRIVDLCSEVLASKPDVRVDIVDMPAGDGKTDPDLFIRERGLAEFRKLDRHSWQFWSWRERLTSTDKLTVAGEAAKQIVVQPDPILRYDMLVNLNRLTGIPMEFLWEAVVRLAGTESTPAAAGILASAQWMRVMRDNEKAAKQAIEQAKAESVMALEAADEAYLPATSLLPIEDPEPVAAVPEPTVDEVAAAWN